GMLDFVPKIESVWKNEPARVKESAEKIKSGFSQSLALGKSTGSLSDDIISKTKESLARRFDSSEGGFGTAPKFPSPHNLLFLTHHHSITGDEDAMNMVSLTLEKMRLGGIWDHVGKGFHRYATDQHWLLPHFEKMLYDQAMLLLAYAEAWKTTGNPLFRETAMDIVQYADECLTSPDGAFFSAEDADSEGEEGKFYVWSKAEIEEILPPGDASLFCEVYQIEKEGNFKDEATRQKTGANIPHLESSVRKEAENRDLAPGELKQKLDEILTVLHDHRQQRERPQLDDKILTDWNGLMIAALARAGVIFEDPALVQLAENAWGVLLRECLRPGGELFHRLKDGEAAIPGMADDYAFLTWGVLELYDATFKPEYLSQAVKLQKIFDEQFLDREHGGYFFTARDAETLLGRQKEIYDGAIPSSNSVAALNGFRLSRLTGKTHWEQQSLDIFKTFSDQINEAPSGYTFALHVYQIILSETMEIVICSPDQNSETDEIIRTSRKKTPPGTALLLKTRDLAPELDTISPFTKDYPVGDKPAVYVCRNFQCEAPVFSKEDLVGVLSG
ncbi:MAG: thioredoxin domain-containing protein, partial [Balneolaceae bacterium]